MKKITPTTTIEVPQTPEAADKLVAEYGDVDRQLQLEKIALEEKIAELKEAHERECKPVREQRDGLFAAINQYCVAHRRTLTGGDKSKSVRFSTAEAKWRTLPPKVTLKGEKAVIEYCWANGLDRFVSQKETVNKTAMQSEIQVASTIDGVKIASAGEQFTISPDKEGNNG